MSPEVLPQPQLLQRRQRPRWAQQGHPGVRRLCTRKPKHLQWQVITSAWDWVEGRRWWPNSWLSLREAREVWCYRAVLGVQGPRLRRRRVREASEKDLSVLRQEWR